MDQENPPESFAIESDGLFEGIESSNTVDYLMRTAQQNQMQLSLMADTKANILITISSIVLSITLSNLDKPLLRLPLLTISAFSLAALLLAILAVVPKVSHPVDSRGQVDKNSPYFNPLFFGHFSALSPREFFSEVDHILRDHARVYQAISRDIYGQGKVLAEKKFLYLRWSYTCFLAGALAAGVEAIVLHVIGYLS